MDWRNLLTKFAAEYKALAVRIAFKQTMSLALMKSILILSLLDQDART